jgi:DNA-binding MarR family transcriptional regulator
VDVGQKINALEEIVDQVRLLAAQLGYSLIPSYSDALNQEETAVTPVRHYGVERSEEARLATARAWLRASAIRKTVLGETSAPDPAWNILLDLYVQTSLRRAVPVSSATIAADVAQTTALRWIVVLQDRGMISRSSDPSDRRRSFLELSAHGLHVIESVLDEAVDSDRKLGLERLTFSKCVDGRL